MKPYVTRVTSNIKGGVDVELGYRTLIVGPSWSGKSAITNSVEYALTAAVSDVVGRQTVKDVNQLLTLSDGASLFAQVYIAELRDEVHVLGAVMSRHAHCETKGKKSTTPEYPAAFPLREVRDALAGSVDTVRKFFLRMTAGTTTRADVEEKIPGPYKELFEQAVSATLVSTPAVDLILHALERSKERARELSAEAKASAAVVTETTQSVEPVKSADLEAARVALATARGTVEDISIALETAKRRARCSAAADDAGRRVIEVTEALAGIAPPAEADRVRAELVELLTFAQAKNLPTCPCCKQERHDATEVAEAFTAGYWATRLASVAKKHAERQDQLAQYTAFAGQLAAARQAAADAEATLAAFTREDDDGSEVVESVEALTGALTLGREAATSTELHLIALERAVATWEQARRSRDLAAEREIQAARWTGLADACKVAVGDLMDASTAAFVEKVQRHLPPEKRFMLRLRDGDREICQYGFARGVASVDSSPGLQLDIALSGGEWALLSAALAAAYVEGSPETALHVIIPEDRSWDARALTQVLTALESAPAQVILATTTEPSKIPAGWTVVRTGEVEVHPEVSVTTTVITTELGAVASEYVKLDATSELGQNGDYIGPIPCSHGVVKDYCTQCLSDRQAKAAVPAAPAPSLSAPKKRGRPAGSKNKKAAAAAVPADGPVELE